MVDPIHTDEWLAELTRLGEQQTADCDGFLTVVEIAKLLGRGKDWVLDRLKIAEKLGQLEIRRRRAITFGGRSIKQRVYRVTKEASDGE